MKKSDRWPYLVVFLLIIIIWHPSNILAAEWVWSGGRVVCNVCGQESSSDNARNRAHMSSHEKSGGTTSPSQSPPRQPYEGILDILKEQEREQREEKRRRQEERAAEQEEQQEEQESRWTSTCPECGNKSYGSTKERAEWEYRQHWQQAHQQQEEQPQQEQQQEEDSWVKEDPVGGVVISRKLLYDSDKWQYGYEIWAYNSNPYPVNFNIWTDGNNYKNVKFSVYNMKIVPRQRVRVGRATALTTDAWKYNYRWSAEKAREFGPLK